MPLASTANEPFGRGKVSALAEPEFKDVAIAVDGALEIPPLTTHLDVRFINVPLAGDQPLAPIELLRQERGIVDGRVVDGDTPLGHHFLKIAQA
jgi:hypothetical protein